MKAHTASSEQPHHELPTAGRALDGVALSATLHCLTGCAIGEVLGMVIGTALGSRTSARSRLQWRSRSSPAAADTPSFTSRATRTSRRNLP